MCYVRKVAGRSSRLEYSVAVDHFLGMKSCLLQHMSLFLQLEIQLKWCIQMYSCDNTNLIDTLDG
jgi:hypothetical protein